MVVPSVFNSTLLKIIAALQAIYSGSLLIKRRMINDGVLSNQSIAVVFKSYAIHRRMAVGQNMPLGLKMQRVPIPNRDIALAHFAFHMHKTVPFNPAPESRIPA